MSMHFINGSSRRRSWGEVFAVYLDGLWRMVVYGAATVVMIGVCALTSLLVSVTVVGFAVPIVIIVGLSVFAYRGLRESGFAWVDVGESLAMQNVIVVVVVAVGVVYLVEHLLTGLF